MEVFIKIKNKYIKSIFALLLSFSVIAEARGGSYDGGVGELLLFLGCIYIFVLFVKNPVENTKDFAAMSVSVVYDFFGIFLLTFSGISNIIFCFSRGGIPSIKGNRITSLLSMIILLSYINSIIVKGSLLLTLLNFSFYYLLLSWFFGFIFTEKHEEIIISKISLIYPNVREKL